MQSVSSSRPGSLPSHPQTPDGFERKRKEEEEEERESDSSVSRAGGEDPRGSDERPLHSDAQEKKKQERQEYPPESFCPSSSTKEVEEQEAEEKEEDKKKQNKKEKREEKTKEGKTFPPSERAVKNDSASGISSPSSRLVIQRVDEATLQVDPATEMSVSIGKGIVVYICFLKGASQATVDDLASMLFKIDALENPGSTTSQNRKISISKSSQDVDILVVPQASLAGRLKANALQFHSLISKTEGEALYESFVDRLQSKARDEETRRPGGRKISVKAGTYGNLQKLKFLSSGPFTTLIEV